jgi:hypothetical protein
MRKLASEFLGARSLAIDVKLHSFRVGPTPFSLDFIFWDPSSMARCRGTSFHGVFAKRGSVVAKFVENFAEILKGGGVANGPR